MSVRCPYVCCTLSFFFFFFPTRHRRLALLLGLEGGRENGRAGGHVPVVDTTEEWLALEEEACPQCVYV